MNGDRERTARSYLLAQLSPEEEEHFEEQLLEDRALRELTEAAEADLHDEFVRGSLAQQDREAFFARFGGRVERIELAEALMTRTRQRQRPARRWLLPLAAALAIAAGLSVLWSSRQGLPPQTPPQTASATPATSSAFRPAAPEIKPQTVVALTIALSAARESGAIPRLDLPAGAGAVALSVRLPPGDDYPRYEIHWTVGGADVWTGPATREKSADAVTATIPAARLEARRYEVIVVGVSREGAREILGTRSVVVHR
jgi:hypothetical protein